MKFGKFVGKKSIRMTAKEQSAFKAKFEKILKAYGNLNFQFDNIEEDNLGKYGYLYHFNFKHDNFVGRNKHFDRVLYFKGVTFTASKEIGYLDLTNWLFTPIKKRIIKNYPSSQYDVYLNIHGHCKPYRKHHEESFSCPNTFEYDTDIKEFKFDKAMKYLQTALTKL